MPSRSATWSSERSRSIDYRGSLGRPSTRSPMMLRWICDAPAAIVSASVRSRSSTSSLSSTCSASRCKRLQAQLAEALPRFGVGELHHHRARTDGAARRLRDVAFREGPQRVELGDATAQLRLQACLALDREAQREVFAQPDRVDQLAHERSAAFVLQRDVRDAPAVVLVADAVRHRDPDVGEEHLGELRAAEHRLERPHLDAGQVHRQDQPRDAAVLRRVGIGAHEELADVGDLAERAPDLLAVQDVVVTVALGARAQRREVGARARLREALAPHLVAAQDLREVRGLLLVAALLDEGRARVQRADEVDADVRRACAGRLLVEDQLLGRRRAPPAVFLGPVQARVTGVEEATLPLGVPLAPFGPRVAGRLRRQRAGARDSSHACSSARNDSSASE